MLISSNAGLEDATEVRSIISESRALKFSQQSFKQQLEKVEPEAAGAVFEKVDRPETSEDKSSEIKLSRTVTVQALLDFIELCLSGDAEKRHWKRNEQQWRKREKEIVRLQNYLSFLTEQASPHFSKVREALNEFEVIVVDPELLRQHEEGDLVLTVTPEQLEEAALRCYEVSQTRDLPPQAAKHLEALKRSLERRAGGNELIHAEAQNFLWCLWFLTPDQKRRLDRIPVIVTKKCCFACRLEKIHVMEESGMSFSEARDLGPCRGPNRARAPAPERDEKLRFITTPGSHNNIYCDGLRTIILRNTETSAVMVEELEGVIRSVNPSTSSSSSKVGSGNRASSSNSSSRSGNRPSSSNSSGNITISTSSSSGEESSELLRVGRRGSRASKQRRQEPDRRAARPGRGMNPSNQQRGRRGMKPSSAGGVSLNRSYSESSPTRRSRCLCG